MQPTTEALQAAARLWLAAGWHPIPLTGLDGKAPAMGGITGYEGKNLTADEIDAAFSGRHVQTLGIRMPPGVLGLDLDNYRGKQGTKTIEALCEELGCTLPPAPSTSGRTDSSEIRFYRVPPDQRWMTDALTEHGGGVDLIHAGWRYAKAWPSIHHETGLTYGRTDLQPGAVTPYDDAGEPWLLPHPDELPDLPGELVAALMGREQAEGREAIGWDNEKGHYPWSDGVHRAWRRWADRGTDRYAAFVPTCAALVRLDSLGQAGASDALDQLRSEYLDAIGDERDGQAEWERAYQGAIRKVASSRSTVEDDLALVAKMVAKLQTAGPPLPVMHTTPSNLPDEFWSARAELMQIRQASWARRRSPDAVLGAVLARLSALTEPAYAIPGTIGAPSTLSTFVALVGPSGTGKSSATHLARELLPTPTSRLNRFTEHGLGSGEGLIELYMGDKDTGEVNAKGKPILEKAQIYSGALATMDEGTALSSMAGREGNTMLATLRSMWTGAQVGQANASRETKRRLDGGKYALGLIVGIQPALAQALLGDTAAGTPQRFLWCSTADPSVPDVRPMWPGALSYRTPPVPRGGTAALCLAPEIEAEIDATSLASVRGELVIDPMDSHRGLLKLKVAGLLALLDMRLNLSVEDWALAEMVLRTSEAVRDSISEVLATEAEVKAAQVDQREARKAKAVRSAVSEVEDEAYDRALTSAAGSIARKAAKEGAIDRSEATRAMSSKSRKLVSADEAIDHALAQGWLIMAVGGKWKPGEISP